MRTAVDSSVILDVLVADPAHGDASEAALRKASGQGALIIGDCVVAEIVPAFPGGMRDVEIFLNDWTWSFIPRRLRPVSSQARCAVPIWREGKRTNLLAWSRTS
jgi:hypothetical protein